MSQSLQAIKQRFGIIGTSKVLDAALDTAVRVANTDLSVLIQGESGVGKEVFSKIIHALSSRKHNSFIAVNCGAIPEGTINSELFGHEKGAFTGAIGERKGYFETVNGGTIFLDEIGEMPLDTQAFLLRVLENGEFIRVGSSKVEKTNVRVLAATNIQLDEAVRRGKFREDLYYRLNTVPIKVPSLKERREDIYLLFRKFSSDFAEKYRSQAVQLDDRAQILIENYAFPGNIRELKNIAEQLSILSEERLISAELLLTMMPQVTQRNLPARTRDYGSANNMDEREILYKLLFEMKNDVNDLKKLVFELINANNLRVPNISQLRQLQSGATNLPSVFEPTEREQYPILSSDFDADDDSISKLMYERDLLVQQRDQANQRSANEALYPTAQPIIWDNKIASGNSFDHHDEIVEENLSLVEMEKRQILKALKKHHNRRKEAADDLAISERTLYRKIKEYELE